jgi:O-antigen/teichoic acid export membrane protein
MALSGKVAYNTAAQVVSKIIGTLVSLAGVALITRYLGSYGFGYYTTAITFVTFFSIAGDLGLTLVTTQLISHPGADQHKLLSNLFTFRLLSALAILILAPIVVIFLPYAPLVKEGVTIAAVAFFFILLNQVFVSLFQKELKADRSAIAEIVSRFIMFFGIAMAAWFNWGLFGILWSMAIANFLSFVLSYYFSRPYAKIRLAFNWLIWKDILKRAWPFVLTIVLNLVYLRADILLLSLLKSPVEVGLYGAAYKVIDVLVSVPFLIGGTVLPILTLRWQAKEYDKYQRAWQKIFNATALLVWPVIIGVFVLATPIMTLVAGQDFILAGPILKILIIAVGGVFFSALFTYTMISFGYQRRLIGAYLFTALTSLILYFVLIPGYSYIGAAWVTVYSEIIMCFLAWFLVRRNSNLKAKMNIFMKAFFASIIMGLIVYYLPVNKVSLGGLSFSVIVGVILYAVALWSFKAIDKPMLKELASWKK